MKGRSLEQLLGDMRGFAVQAQEFVGTMSLGDFQADLKTQMAVMHVLLYLGEAAKLVAAEDRARFPAIPWGLIIGMRNQMAHNYLGGDTAVTYDTVVNDLPSLLAQLDVAIAEGG